MCFERAGSIWRQQTRNLNLKGSYIGDQHKPVEIVSMLELLGDACVHARDICDDQTGPSPALANSFDSLDARLLL